MTAPIFAKIGNNKTISGIKHCDFSTYAEGMAKCQIFDQDFCQIQ